jgi:hypothetical protein
VSARRFLISLAIIGWSTTTWPLQGCRGASPSLPSAPAGAGSGGTVIGGTAGSAGQGGSIAGGDGGSGGSGGAVDWRTRLDPDEAWLLDPDRWAERSPATPRLVCKVREWLPSAEDPAWSWSACGEGCEEALIRTPGPVSDRTILSATSMDGVVQPLAMYSVYATTRDGARLHVREVVELNSGKLLSAVELEQPAGDSRARCGFAFPGADARLAKVFAYPRDGSQSVSTFTVSSAAGWMWLPWSSGVPDCAIAPVDPGALVYGCQSVRQLEMATGVDRELDSIGPVSISAVGRRAAWVSFPGETFGTRVGLRASDGSKSSMLQEGLDICPITATEDGLLGIAGMSGNQPCWSEVANPRLWWLPVGSSEPSIGAPWSSRSMVFGRPGGSGDIFAVAARFWMEDGSAFLLLGRRSGGTLRRIDPGPGRFFPVDTVSLDSDHAYAQVWDGTNPGTWRFLGFRRYSTRQLDALGVPFKGD